MAQPVDFDNISGYYVFLSADNFSVNPGDPWNEYFLAHTKGICHVAKVDKVVLVHLTDPYHQNVWMGGPRYFTLDETFHENIPKNVKIYPVMDNAISLKLTWSFSEFIVRQVTYKFYGQTLIAEFETIVCPFEPVSGNVAIVEFSKLTNVIF